MRALALEDVSGARTGSSSRFLESWLGGVRRLGGRDGPCGDRPGGEWLLAAPSPAAGPRGRPLSAASRRALLVARTQCHLPGKDGSPAPRSPWKSRNAGPGTTVLGPSELPRRAEASACPRHRTASPDSAGGMEKAPLGKPGRSLTRDPASDGGARREPVFPGLEGPPGAPLGVPAAGNPAPCAQRTACVPVRGWRAVGARLKLNLRSV
ncbi:hypothetical protein R6Z07F_011119 [Ovis aries]